MLDVEEEGAHMLNDTRYYSTEMTIMSLPLFKPQRRQLVCYVKLLLSLIKNVHDVFRTFRFCSSSSLHITTCPSCWNMTIRRLILQNWCRLHVHDMSHENDMSFLPSLPLRWKLLALYNYYHVCNYGDFWLMKILGLNFIEYYPIRFLLNPYPFVKVTWNSQSSKYKQSCH